MGPHARIPRTHSQWVVGPGSTPQLTGGWGWESAQSRTPRQEAPPEGTLMPPPQRAKPARKSARCGVGDGSPRPHSPHPQPVGSGPRRHARKDEWSGVGERLTPDAPQPGKRRPPWAPSCRPHNAQSQLARARAVRWVIGPHARTPLHPQPVGSGPRPHASNDGRSGVGERPIPDSQARGPPPLGTLMPPPQRAKPVRKSARGGVGDGSPRPHPPHPQPVGSGLQPHALKDEWSGVGERPTPDAPHPGKRRPPGAPWCRLHSAKSQLARARAVGLVTGPHACTPRTHSQWVITPRPHARKDEWSGVGECPTPDAPYPGKRRPPRGPSCRPHSAQSQLARARAVGLVMGPHARTPCTHSQWVVGPGRTPERTSGRGWESARPQTLQTQARGAPPGHPHSAPTACKASSQERAL